jgi:hypothetical protein
MKPLTDKDRQAHAVVEAALQTYPRAQAPARFVDEVMRRVQAYPGYVVPRPKFQFPWWELLASIILSVMLAVVWLVWRILPPVYLAQLRVQWLIILQRLGLLGRGEMLAWLIPLAVLLAVVFLGGAAVVFTSRRDWQSG